MSLGSGGLGLGLGLGTLPGPSLSVLLGRSGRGPRSRPPRRRREAEALAFPLESIVRCATTYARRGHCPLLPGPATQVSPAHVRQVISDLESESGRRGFKTARSGGSSGLAGGARSGGRFGQGALGSILRQRWEAASQASKDEAARSEGMTKLLDGEASEEARHRLGSAFTQGFVAGQSSRRGADPAQPAKTLLSFSNRLLFRVLIYSFILYVFVKIMSGGFSMSMKSGGGIQRMLMGNEEGEVNPEDVHVTFQDVKGVREAKAEMEEVVEYLADPEKFSRLGGRLPKGVLLVGPPGTGKTLLARAIAGEAGVPFFHASGSEFDEVLVGQGARRVRDLFANAKERAPAVIFIDEIDSVGAKRVNTSVHPYANQTINQLLAEMDGFEGNQGVIVIGATNRREDLDKALLRPGRFDVQVEVQLPDLKDRTEIFELYLGKVQCQEEVEAKPLAEITTGFTGADIENMVNTAAIRAAADGLLSVSHKYLTDARDKVSMGPERKNRIPDEQTNRNTAFHEAGHALVAFYTKGAMPIDKVTIVPRGQSLGHTGFTPPEASLYQQTRGQLLASLDVAMGGRAAEELIFGYDNVSTGAMSDLRQASDNAAAMVKVYGFSEKVGLRYLDDYDDARAPLGPQTQEAIDTEIRRLLQESYERAANLLKTHAKEHKRLAEALLQHETLDASAVAAIANGKPIPVDALP